MTANGPSLRRTVTMGNPPLGLHLRPATLFVKTARAFRCKVTVIAGEKKANGHSPFDLLSLIAVPGTELTLEIEGEDAEAAFAALAAILAAEAADSSSAG